MPRALHHSPALEPEPGRWRYNPHPWPDGSNRAIVSCPKCGELGLMDPHPIDVDGLAYDVDCPGCGWREDVLLSGWRRFA